MRRKHTEQCSITDQRAEDEEGGAFEEPRHTEHGLQQRQAQHLHHHQVVRRKKEPVAHAERPQCGHFLY